MDAKKHWITGVIAAVVIPLSIWVAVRVAPSSDYYRPMDFAVYYTAARAFVTGANPYDRAVAMETWTAAGGEYGVMDLVLGESDGDPAHAAEHWLPIVQIPPSLPVLSFLGVFGAPRAWVVWLTLVALLLPLQLYATLRIARIPVLSIGAILLVACTISLEPVHIGLLNGQPTIPCISLVVIAVWLSQIGRRWEWAAGLLLAIAMAVKPQLAGPFVLWFLWDRKPRVAIAAIGGMVVFTGIALGVMHTEGIAWLADWTREMNDAATLGGINDPRTANIGRHDMLHLPILLHLFSDRSSVVLAMTAAVVVAMAIVLIKSADSRDDRITSLASFAILALLPVYHRYYDAAIIVLAMAAALHHWNAGRRLPSAGLLAIAAMFMISQEWVDGRFRAAGEAGLQTNVWMNLFVVPHHVWELLAIFSILVWSLRLARGKRGEFMA